MLIFLSIVAILLFTLLCFRVRSVGVRQQEVVYSGVGVTVVVEHLDSVAQVCRLLSCDLSPYEVVVVADFSSRRELLGNMIRYFSLLKVSYVESGELREGGVVVLYRSRKRLYRRLIVVRRSEGGVPSSLQIAASLASYDFVLALPRGRGLRRDAIAMLLRRLERADVLDVDRVVSLRGERFVMLRREWALVGHSAWHNINSGNCVRIYKQILNKERKN